MAKLLFFAKFCNKFDFAKSYHMSLIVWISNTFDPIIENGNTSKEIFIMTLLKPHKTMTMLLHVCKHNTLAMHGNFIRKTI